MTPNIKLPLAAVMALAASACASFEGVPRAVPLSGVEDDYYSLANVRARLLGKSDMEQRAIRNAAVAMHIRAYDREYVEFLISLGVDRKAANLILEVGAIGLSSIGAVSTGSANEISAAVAGLSGARGSVNRNLYYEQTLPAIVGAMEANRLQVKAEIRTHLLNDSMAQYPFEQALSDLLEYRLAQSLDRAVLEVTKEAGQAQEAARDRYENAIRTCEPDADLRPSRLRLNHYLYGLATGADAGAPVAGSENATKLETLSKIATLVNGSPVPIAVSAAEANAQAAAILRSVAKDYCTKDALTALIGRISTDAGGTVP